MGVSMGGSGGKWSSNVNGIHYTAGYVGIGTDLPTQPLEIYSNSAAYTFGGRVFANSAAGFNVRTFKARGTISIPLRARANDVITGYNGFPYYAVDDVTTAIVNATQANAQFQFKCTEAATATGRGTSFNLNLTPIGATIVQTELLVYHDGTVLHFNLANLPTSAVGLNAGDIWVDTAAGNVLKIV